MDKKIRRPYSTNNILTVLLICAGAGLFYFDQVVSAILTLSLAAIIMCIQLFLWCYTGIFNTKHPTKKTYTSYRNLAKFYLNDRRLECNKKTFKMAIEHHWMDIVTMCLILGIKEAYDGKNREEIIFEVIDLDDHVLLSCLLNAKFYHLNEVFNDVDTVHPILYA